MAKIVKPLLFVMACEAAGLIGAVFTFQAVAAWYPTLAKPAFSPPDWIFGPVWTVLYARMGISAYIVWSKGGFKNRKVRIAVSLFAVQLVLNVLWSVVFFGLRYLFYSVIEIAILWITVVATTAMFYRISKEAALLMVPYLLWTTFAMALNVAIWRLN